MKILNKNKILFLIILIAFLTFSCSTGNEPEKEGNINIYLFEDSNLRWQDVQGRNPDSLRMIKWLTDDMISSYDYSSHVIYLKDGAKEKLFASEYLNHYRSRAFSMYVKGNRCYSGSLLYSGYIPTGSVYGDNIKGYSEDAIQIAGVWNFININESITLHNSKDVRSNDILKNALLESGKFLPGINVTLDEISFLKDSTLKLRGKVSITNNENNPLLLPDISYQISSSAISTSFHQQIFFYNENKMYWLHTSDKTLECSLLDNYTLVKLNKNETKTFYFNSPLQNAQNSDYPPDGNYYCYFMYFGIMQCKKSERMKDNARLWMGSRKSNTMYVNFDRQKGITILSKDVAFE